MRSLVFEGDTWLIYEELRQNDAKQHRVLCRLLKELLRGEPTQGTGKPERLKHQLSGLWSRRISKKDRLIYSFDDKYIYIFAIGGHYER
ncbi:Txe/YoeB family addiction module toxin [Geitlerinema sp. P-1104]|uniref:Txe/YoeB family addiction module toxin n=1 Tax=Geitlerinema sp. P-1104 TaxID=2546230 RepID=UPI001476FF46|nr:Txe/YoeB family addiction module toxin [Geitlerinema sp. P-1104]NMG60148.1 Txe/YoeB family addiction module toxin [Geitlerinema sp. P-1104]